MIQKRTITSVQQAVQSVEASVAQPLNKSVEKKWISSGCPTLNLALSGNVMNGYAVGTTVNMIGDYSSGKTLLACEAANVVHYIEGRKKGKRVKVRYNEPERKFNFKLAADNGMLLDEVEWVNSTTIEEMYTDFSNTLKLNMGKQDVLLYIVDSLDSFMGDRSKKHISKKGIGAQDYKVDVPNVMSNLFKLEQDNIKRCNCIFFIISQLRDKIGANPYQNPYRRAGGHALNFFATHIIWLWECGTIKHDNGMEQGIRVRPYVEKNHVAPEGRKAEFTIAYKFGIDMVGSAVEWASENGALTPYQSGSWYNIFGLSAQGKDKLIVELDNNRDVFEQFLLEIVQKRWDDMEAEATIVRRPKY